MLRRRPHLGHLYPAPRCGHLRSIRQHTSASADVCSGIVDHTSVLRAIVPVDVIQQRLCHLFDLNMHDTLNSIYTYIAIYTSARVLRSRVLRSGVPLRLLASAHVSIRRRMLWCHSWSTSSLRLPAYQLSSSSTSSFRVPAFQQPSSTSSLRVPAYQQFSCTSLPAAFVY